MPSGADIIRRMHFRVMQSIRRRGVGGSLGLVPGFVAARLKGDPERRFDSRFRVDTAGILKPTELQRDRYFKDSNWYAPVATALFRRMLREVRVDYRDYIFVDFGCGKGKALLLAARLPFKEIIGIELWQTVLEVAGRNVREYTGKRQCQNVRLQCINAVDFRFSSDPALYYFFDPFKIDVMSRVLANLRASLIQWPRESYVLYCEPERHDVLNAADFLIPVKQTSHFAIYRTCSPANLIEAPRSGWQS
jgi:SAM-dependent methyltransferase